MDYENALFQSLLLFAKLSKTTGGFPDVYPSCCRLAAELESDDTLGGPTEEEVQQAARLEADSAQDLQHKMLALQDEVQRALTELRNRHQQSVKHGTPASRLQVRL